MNKIEPWTGGTEEEYETQHFGFGAQRLKIAVRQMIEQKITNGVKDMESYLQESLHLNDTDKATLTTSCDKLIRLYCERAGPSLDIIDKQVSHEEYEQLKDEVDSLKKRIQRGALMDALLKAEEEELATVNDFCDMAKKDMETIDFISKSIDNGCKSVVNETALLCASANVTMKDDPNKGNIKS